VLHYLIGSVLCNASYFLSLNDSPKASSHLIKAFLTAGVMYRLSLLVVFNCHRVLLNFVVQLLNSCPNFDRPPAWASITESVLSHRCVLSSFYVPYLISYC
jgi:hypothetical protein